MSRKKKLKIFSIYQRAEAGGSERSNSRKMITAEPRFLLLQTAGKSGRKTVERGRRRENLYENIYPAK
jgi:hypothetical protein